MDAKEPCGLAMGTACWGVPGESVSPGPPLLPASSSSWEACSPAPWLALTGLFFSPLSWASVCVSSLLPLLSGPCSATPTQLALRMSEIPQGTVSSHPAHPSSAASTPRVAPFPLSLHIAATCVINFASTMLEGAGWVTTDGRALVWGSHPVPAGG